MQKSFPHMNSENTKIYQEGIVIMKNGIEEGKKEIDKIQEIKTQQQEISQQTKK
jgi:hypothetical protein